jgi:RHS repeat-associated protein
VFSFGFSTKYHDRETGMVDYKRRFYRPNLGRWLNRDPIEEEGGENLYAFCRNNPVLYIDILGEDFWGYFVDAAKTLSGAFTIWAGFTLGATAGWTGGGAIAAAGLIAIGVDQFASGARNLVNRAHGKSVSNNTYAQVAYKYATQKITHRSGSMLEQSLDAVYFSAEVVSACATGTMSIRGSITAIRSVGPAKTVGRWITVNGYLQYQFYMTESLSYVEAAGIVATETFSTTVSGISFFSSSTNDVDVIDIGNGGNYDW